MRFLAFLVVLAIPVAAMLVLRAYRKSFSASRKTTGDSSARWNEVILEARKLRAAAKAATAQQNGESAAKPGSPPRPPS